MKRLYSLYLLMAVFIAVALCSAEDSYAQPQRKVPIRLGVDVSTMGLAFWVADSEGIFDKYGLQAITKTHDIGFMGLLAIGAGEGDTSIQSESPTVVNIAKGIDAIIVATIARGPQTYKAIAKKEIKGPRDLIGKTIGITVGAGGEYFLNQYLKKHAIDVRQVTIQDAAPPELSVMLYKGELDAVFVWEPFGRKIMGLDKAADRLAVFTSGKDYYNATFFLTVGRRFAEQNPEAVKNLLRALAEANRFIAQNKEKCIRITKYILRTSQEEAAAAVEDYVSVPPILEKDALPALMNISAWLKEKGRIKSIPDWKTIVQPRYLREVDPSKVQL
ncbi:MAG: ABC transporter substrate-binding protein [Betaproteobacteria bacterium]|nr:ABC transporter substrate-binding protein [Betaproteobacteria bacterium]